MKTLPDIHSLRSALQGKRVLVRASLNVPLSREGEIADLFRLKRTLPTLEFLASNGARVIVIGHIGRDPKLSLLPVCQALKVFIPITFCPELTGRVVESALSEMEDGTILMLENLRSDPREVMNDPDFSKELASFGDLYVNDAFAVSHRSHASIVGIPKHLSSYAGILLQEEVHHLKSAFDPADPALLILGGGKPKTKAPLIRKFLDRYSTLFIGGVLANDLYKARGYDIGSSAVSDTPDDLTDLVHHEKIILPSDVTVKGKRGVFVKRPDELLPDDYIVDAGPRTLEELEPNIKKAAFILWNGPLGEYEKGFPEYTEKLARLISNSSAASIVGGGDTMAAIQSLKLIDAFTFVSTGGGAMLNFLANETLPGMGMLHE